MIKSPMRIALCAALISLAPVSSAFAFDKDPTGAEKAMISQALLDQGFQNWGKIKFDDGLWEVDDARGYDGREVKLKLDRYFMVVEVDD
jgi:hypothetical protein